MKTSVIRHYAVSVNIEYETCPAGYHAFGIVQAPTGRKIITWEDANGTQHEEILNKGHVPREFVCPFPPFHVITEPRFSDAPAPTPSAKKAKQAISAFRATYPEIVKSWGKLENTLLLSGPPDRSY